MARPLPLALLLLLGAGALYLPSVRNGFVYDDHEVILLQPAPRGVADVARMFAEPHGLPLSRLPYYRAPTRASLLVQKAIHGDVAAPFHAVNAILAGVAAALAFALLRRSRFGLGDGPACFAAALFAAHPVMSACVHPIASGRETLLPATFSLAAMLGLLSASRGARAAGIAAFALALLGKEQAIVLPAAVVWADLAGMSDAPPGRSARAWIARLLPLAGVVAGYLALRAAIFGIALQRPGEEAPPLQLLGPLLSLLYSLQSLFVPFVELRYEPLLAAWWSPARITLAVALASAVVLDGLVQRDAAWRRRTLFWLGWGALLLLPTANLTRQEAPFDERYALLSSLAAAAIVAGVLARRMHTGAARPLAALGAALVLGLASISLARGAWYRDALGFQRQWAETSPEHANARMAYGTALLRAGDEAAARRELEAAVRLAPAHAMARFNLAVLLAGAGELDAAAEQFRAVLRIDPGDAEARANLAKLEALLQRRGAGAAPAARSAAGAAPGAASPDPAVAPPAEPVP